MERGHHSARCSDYNPKFIGKKLIIKMVDALAGAGKTFAAGKHAARTARVGHKTLFVQPTKNLITETITGIRQHSPDIRLTAIHSDTTEHVVADIVQHTKNADEHQGEIRG
jgi:reverse gyrase